MERTYSAKYDAKLSTKEIAARIREDLKNAAHAGVFSHAFKFSVRKRHHRSIDVSIKAAPADFVKENPDHDRMSSCATERDWLTPEARRVLDAVKQIANAYNHDGSDIMTDYFDVNYYLSVDYDLPVVADAVVTQ